MLHILHKQKYLLTLLYIVRNQASKLTTVKNVYDHLFKSGDCKEYSKSSSYKLTRDYIAKLKRYNLITKIKPQTRKDNFATYYVVDYSNVAFFIWGYYSELQDYDLQENQINSKKYFKNKFIVKLFEEYLRVWSNDLANIIWMTKTKPRKEVFTLDEILRTLFDYILPKILEHQLNIKYEEGLSPRERLYDALDNRINSEPNRELKEFFEFIYKVLKLYEMNLQSKIYKKMNFAMNDFFTRILSE